MNEIEEILKTRRAHPRLPWQPKQKGESNHISGKAAEVGRPIPPAKPKYAKKEGK